VATVPPEIVVFAVPIVDVIAGPVMIVEPDRLIERNVVGVIVVKSVVLLENVALPLTSRLSTELSAEKGVVVLDTIKSATGAIFEREMILENFMLCSFVKVWTSIMH
jgi:hypothetical protein